MIIIDPDLGMFDSDRSRTVDEAVSFLRSSMVWHLWPKTVPSPDGALLLSTSIDGETEPIPSADRIPTVAPFAMALEKARRFDGHRYTRKSAPLDVGTMALQLSPAVPSDADEFSAARPIDGPRRHIARMRRVELVVDYFVGEEHPDSRFGYSGVFIGSEEADDVFGRAEPPTHDAWVTAGLRGTDLGVVNNLGAFLRDAIQKEVGPKKASKSSTETAGLGRLAARLGSVTRSFSGTGAGSDGPASDKRSGGGGEGGGGGSRRRKATKPRIVQGPSVVVEDGVAFLRALVEVPASDDDQAVVATTQVVLDGGGLEEDPPEGTAAPDFFWRREEDDSSVVQGPVLSPGTEIADRWWLSATIVDDAAVRLIVDWKD